MEEEKGSQVDKTGGALFQAPLFVTAAHELKAPLALMRQLSLNIEQGMSPDEVIKIAQQITLTSERALRLTTDLTRTARLEDGLFTLGPVNSASLCREVIEELGPLYHAKGRAIAMKPSRRPAIGVANHDLLRRIVLNFADNALHYSASNVPVILETHVYNHGKRVRLGVRDYGPGITNHVRRGLKNGSIPINASRPESSGLGLYVARQFADAMNATIGMLSHRDGVTFYVDIAASTQLRLL